MLARWFNFDLVVAVQDGEEDIAYMIQQVANTVADGEYDPADPNTSKRPFELRVRELMPPVNATPQEESEAAPQAENNGLLDNLFEGEEEFIPSNDSQ